MAAVNSKPESAQTRLLASLPNFEEAYFGKEIKSEKPYNALKTISTDDQKFETIEKLLIALIDHDAELPEHCAEWKNMEDLQEKLNLELGK